jgi:DNA polymerase-3 subunit gamma/tau
MSFEVLARKYRPQTFDEVVGQEHITLTLKKAVQSGRISHAYLLSGPRGCGKTSTARILAKVVNCQNLNEGNPCDACPPCLGVIQGKNLDVMEIDGATHTGVAEVRDLQESIGYAPSQYKNKVYIIDEVHMLSSNAFNALLKTLEEPPAHVYFIFATTAPHKIPETIKSRCQRHHFKRLQINEIASQLESICAAENVRFDAEALRLLARKAEGSMRDGESLLDQCITASSGTVVAESVRNILGLLDAEMVVSFLETMSRKDPTAVLKSLDTAIDEGIDLFELAAALLEGFRDLMILSSPGDLSDLVFRSSDEIERLRSVLASYELPDLVTMVERLCNVIPRLKLASDPRIMLESTLVDLTLLDRQTDIRTLLNSLGGAGGGSAARGERPRSAGSAGDPNARNVSGPGAGHATVSPRHAASFPSIGAPASGSPSRAEDGHHGGPPLPDGAGIDRVRALWNDLITEVRQKKVALGVSLMSGHVVDFNETTVFLRFGKNHPLDRRQIEDPVNGKFLKKMIARTFGREFDVACLSEDDPVPGAPETAKSATPAVSAGAEIEQLPITKKILREFDGEIVQRY